MHADSYGEWHTLTIDLDGEDAEGNPGPGYSLDHPDSCPRPDPTDFHPAYDCWLADLVGEFADCPDLIGLPTTPGVYRARAWGTLGSWAGPHYVEPESGVEIEQ
ncbi:hypothetical protein [Nocardia suismassiliense]|uniref:hypothetical protein n=1 Tax=Nocardia suismassiliense TaxID=2077092 RepID=UPI000D1D600D|nr:hypothetical protein [Nocardia suismassiliense]